MQRKFKSSYPLLKFRLNFSLRYVRLEAEGQLNRKIALLAKMAFPSSGTLLCSLAKPASHPMTL
ncbi:hypothetical protein [uncultured Campylobacter sp.]|uniref:hypothetical protein n=1 Tax=uncultured Campylobacter sp. TaxID=218934 RepID=UPI0026381659|nr:hypothetical protein [uncultured Campylobacter sp.]